MIFSATSLNASPTPTAVLAEVSMKREFIRRAKASPSEVGTCRENSCMGVFNVHESGGSERQRTLSTLFPTMILTTDSET